MENIGVAVGIVIDDHKKMDGHGVMSDDGTGGGIRIPSMLISKDDGDVLLEWFKSASVIEKTQLVIMAEFKVTHQDDVEFDYWFTSSSNRALDFIEDFLPFQEKLASNITFEPHHVYWSCGENCDKEYLSANCYGGGKYCAIEPSN
jgi:hypothetical protein